MRLRTALALIAILFCTHPTAGLAQAPDTANPSCLDRLSVHVHKGIWVRLLLNDSSKIEGKLFSIEGTSDTGQFVLRVKDTTGPETQDHKPRPSKVKKELYIQLTWRDFSIGRTQA